jgi:hypothetical protein
MKCMCVMVLHSFVFKHLLLRCRSHRLWPENLDTTGSLQRQMTGEPNTSYQIRFHHLWLKRRVHQPKKPDPGMIHTGPPSHHDSQGQVGFYHMFTHSIPN